MAAPPKPSPQKATSEAASTYVAYRLHHSSAEALRSTLASLLADRSDVRIVSDAEANQVLVTGPADAQQIVRQTISALDRPATAPASATEAATVRTYAYAGNDFFAAAKTLRAQLPDLPTIRVTGDPQTRQLVVIAPPSVHARIPTLLASLADNDTAQRSGVPTSRHQTLAVSLANSRAERVEALLQEMFGKRITRAPQAPNELPAWLLTSHGDQRVEIEVDTIANRLIVHGPGKLVPQVARLIQVLDSPRPTDGRTVRIVPLGKSDPAKVEQAVEAYRGHGVSAPEPAVKTPNPLDQGRRQNSSNVQLAAALEPIAGARSNLARTLFQKTTAAQRTNTRVAQLQPPSEAEVPTAEPAAPVGEPGVPALSGAEPTERERQQLRELGADVEIENLGDLDVVILRGRERDVEELVRIIEEIERISAETVPLIEVYPLKHAGSDALTQVITQIQAELLTGRQGRARVTALHRPNALLIIGWGEALRTVTELIEKLDQPVAPESLFRVFRLRNAAATALQVTLLDFFKPVASQPPSVSVTSDRRTNSLVVQASPRDLAEIELLIERLDVAGGSAVNVLRVFRLQNTLAGDLGPVLQSAILGTGPGAAQQAGTTGQAAQRQEALEFLTIDAEGQQLLKSGALNDVRITPEPRTNTLLISAPPETIDLLTALVTQLDQQPATTAQIKVFRIVNGDASRLVIMLQSLLGTQAVLPGGPQLAGAEGEGSLAPLRFSVEQRTNSIIASGSPGDLTIVEAILLRLDETDIQERKSMVYRLKNAPSVDVADSINEFLRSERRVQQVVPGTFSPFQQIEAEVVVVPEPVSNSLIISATTRFYDEIVKIVERLDAQPPQVMIQVLIGEVQLNNADEFGIELGIQDSLLFDRSLLGNLVTLTNTAQNSTPAGIVTATQQNIISASNTPGFAFNDIGAALPNSGSTSSLATAGNVAGQAVSNFATGRSNTNLGFGGLVMSASSENVSVLIRALRENRRLDVLSRPQVMTLDNQPAFIQVGQKVPQITASALSTFGLSNSITLINVGLILGVTPRISPDGTVVMELDAEKSEVGPDIEGIPISFSPTGNVIRSPRINTTLAQTTVSAADGQTIVLGGLITKKKQAVNRRVPYVSDIPVLGMLFRYDLMVASRSELIIILTPHVVRGESDANEVKQAEAARMSWCLGDVNAFQGETGIHKRGQSEVVDDATVVIYPDDNPRGEVEAVETPEPNMTTPDGTPPTNGTPAGPQLTPPGFGGSAPATQQVGSVAATSQQAPRPQSLMTLRNQPATTIQSPSVPSNVPGQPARVGTVIYSDPNLDEPTEQTRPATGRSAMNRLRGAFRKPTSPSVPNRGANQVQPAGYEATESNARSVGKVGGVPARPDAAPYLPKPAKQRNTNRP